MQMMVQPPGPTRAGLPAQVAAGDDPAVLARIAEPGVNLALWRRRTPARLATVLAEADLAPVTLHQATGRPEAAVDAVAVSLLAAGLAAAVAAALADELRRLARLQAGLLASPAVAVRLERITGDGCKRFHADHMAARLIATLRGPGTEWLADADAARVVEGRPPADATVHRLPTGAVAVMKGRLWSRDRPLVHRSPPIAGTGSDRLVAVVDAAEPD